MNFLKGNKAYLSGPITFDDLDKNWRDEPMRVLTERFGIDLFDPFSDPKQQYSKELNEALDRDDFEETRRIAKRFVRKDLSKVDESRFVIAYLPWRVPTTGTHHEIINANNSKKPTLLVCPEGRRKISPWYWGFIKQQFIFGSWSSLYDYLAEVDDGKHQDNDRWHLVYGMI